MHDDVTPEAVQSIRERAQKHLDGKAWVKVYEADTEGDPRDFYRLDEISKLCPHEIKSTSFRLVNGKVYVLAKTDNGQYLWRSKSREWERVDCVPAPQPLPPFAITERDDEREAEIHRSKDADA